MQDKYIKWDKDKIEDWLSDKFTKRGLDIEEYEFITKTIREEIKPTIIIDVGTFLGISGYIIGTSSPNINKLYAIEHHNGPTFSGPYKNLVTVEDYGKYLPEHTIFKTYGYEKDLEPILCEHQGDNIFVFFDAGKNSIRVFDQISLSHKYKVPFIAFHDTNIRSVKRAIKHSINIGLYELYKEYRGDEKYKGIIILRRINK